MDFLSGIFVAIAAWFGFGEPVVETPSEVIVVEERPEEAVMVVEEEQIKKAEEADKVEEAEAQSVVEEAIEPVDPVETVLDKNETEDMMGEGTVVEVAPVVPAVDVQTMMVAGGCFWCVEANLEKVEGVIEVVSGYAGGDTKNPTYKTYGSGGHREVVEVTYDANKVSFEEILIVTMKTTDPTDDDGTFADRGDKYSSAFYYANSAQQQIIENLISEVDQKGPYDKPLAIDVEPLPEFWSAEDSHQDYYKGALTKLKYKYYRNASGRDDFIEKYWGDDIGPELSWRNEVSENNKTYMWTNYQKPSEAELKEKLDSLTFKVTQKDGTERSHSSPLDKNWEDGIYVDVLSGEPLYSSKDKFDSGTGWPSFVKPITDEALTLHEDRKLFSVRTETRSAIADNHIGHVFNDGPADRGGLRYCMNGVALKFIPKEQMEELGYGDYLQFI